MKPLEYKINYTIVAVQNYLSALMSEIDDKEAGQSMVEYVLIIALIAIVAVLALTGLGSKIVAELKKITSSL